MPNYKCICLRTKQTVHSLVYKNHWDFADSADKMLHWEELLNELFNSILTADGIWAEATSIRSAWPVKDILTIKTRGAFKDYYLHKMAQHLSAKEIFHHFSLKSAGEL